MPTNRDPQLDLADSEVSQLDDFALCDELWSLVVETYHRHESTDGESARCNYPESLFAKDLSLHWWVAYALHAFEYDVLAGGIDQFFDNHWGLTNVETLVAFKHVGAHEYAEVFASACAVFDLFKDLFAPNQTLDDDAYAQRRALFKEQLSPIERRLFTMLRGDHDPRSYLASFIRKNPDLFRQQPTA